MNIIKRQRRAKLKAKENNIKRASRRKNESIKRDTTKYLNMSLREIRKYIKKYVRI